MSDLFNMDLNDGMSFLDKKEKGSNDGILRLDPKKATDKKKGLRVVLRFLPNFTKEGKLGSNAIEKFVHYVKLQNYQDLNGYYDSQKQLNETCALTNLYWELKNSKSVVEQEKAELISRSAKYYSYVQVIEHETEPELIGKIMIFPFGIKIKNKINEERTGEITGTQVNVYDLSQGKDFVCIVKQIGDYPNYDSSQFKSNVSAIQILNKEGVLKEVPTIEKDGKKLIEAKFQEKIKEYLLNREVELDEFSAKRWDDETRTKVNKIVNVLKNNPIIEANESIKSSNKKNDESFFDDEDEESYKPKAKTTASKAKDDDDDFFDED